MRRVPNIRPSPKKGRESFFRSRRTVPEKPLKKASVVVLDHGANVPAVPGQQLVRPLPRHALEVHDDGRLDAPLAACSSSIPCSRGTR